MAVNLSTNGTLLPRRPKVLDAVHRLQISVDGHPSVPEAPRGAGAFADVLGALAMARDAGVPVVLSVVLMRPNAPAARRPVPEGIGVIDPRCPFLRRACPGAPS